MGMLKYVGFEDGVTTADVDRRRWRRHRTETPRSCFLCHLDSVFPLVDRAFFVTSIPCFLLSIVLPLHRVNTLHLIVYVARIIVHRIVSCSSPKRIHCAQDCQ